MRHREVPPAKKVDRPKPAPASKGPTFVEDIMKDAGLDAEAAKRRLHELGASFQGPIPAGALAGWVESLAGHSRAFWTALAREWEKG